MGQRKERPDKPILETSVDSSNSSFVRALGSTDWHTRDAALSKLSLWLSRAPVSDLALLKLWKGVFYAFWHSDKTPVQASNVHARLPAPLAPNILVSEYVTSFSMCRMSWLSG